NSKPDATQELDALLEVYTSAILAEKDIPEPLHRAVARVLRQHLPPLTRTDDAATSAEKNTAIAAPLPMANPASGNYPSHWPQLKSGPYLVHMGAYRNEQECRELAENLAKENIPTWMDMVRTPDDKKIVRLLVGPFASYDHVLKVVKTLSGQTGLAVGWIQNPYWQEWRKS
ncbi:MAG: SPOR domain-containing protein, partial [Magnetococcales bacterium]|nr:SPOR domain-containing protein [Magnetococcales bacterium]